MTMMSLIIAPGSFPFSSFSATALSITTTYWRRAGSMAKRSTWPATVVARLIAMPLSTVSLCPWLHALLALRTSPTSEVRRVLRRPCTAERAAYSESSRFARARPHASRRSSDWALRVTSETMSATSCRTLSFAENESIWRWSTINTSGSSISASAPNLRSSAGRDCATIRHASLPDFDATFFLPWKRSASSLPVLRVASAITASSISASVTRWSASRESSSFSSSRTLQSSPTSERKGIWVWRLSMRGWRWCMSPATALIISTIPFSMKVSLSGLFFGVFLAATS
mmetsp:Transcript_47656/g.113443  ORF Transcript_47656/g.113443 Transcript_47656/m.113443 type:complete len:286 (+) Transcript_47656:1111-1968(+)